MTTCNLPIQSMRPAGLVTGESDSPLLAWVRQFNWVNYLGLAMFLSPILFGYGAVHFWLLQHDPLMYYASLYAQLGLILIAWRQLW